MTTVTLKQSTRRSQGSSRVRPALGAQGALLTPIRWVLLAVWLIAIAAATIAYGIGAMAVAGAAAIGGRRASRTPHARAHRP